MLYTVHCNLAEIANLLFLINHSSGGKISMFVLLFESICYMFSISDVASSSLHDVLLVLRGLTDNLGRRGEEL